VARYARSHGPFEAHDVAARFGAGVDRVRAALETLEAADRVLHGEFRPGGRDREWCDPDVLRRIRRRSLARLRREIEPVDAAAFARFLPAWQGADRPRGGVDALIETIGRLQGASIPASILESDVLPARVNGFRPTDLDGLVASGEIVWIGRGSIGANDGRVAVLFRERAGVLMPAPPDDRPVGAVHDAIRTHLGERGASFWSDLFAAAGVADQQVVLRALWDLVWAGEITNDTLAPLRAFTRGAGARRQRPGGRPRPGALRAAGPPAGAGRWSLVERLAAEPAPTERAHALAMQLLDRHGVLTREATLAEEVPGGFAAVYPVLRAMEESGTVRRGYFVAGLGAAQFALPGAIDRLRAVRDPAPDAEIFTLAAADPAQPFGATLPWPGSAGRPSRSAGAFVLIHQGQPVAFLERGGKTLTTFGSVEPDVWADALAALVKDGRVRRIELRSVDGVPVWEHAALEALRAAGFAEDYRGVTLRG
jgi:ATP-dependent Lhr-like helicase